MNRSPKTTAVKTACMLLCLLLFITSGCAKELEQDQNRNQNQQQKKAPSHELKTLLPQKPKFKWVYTGFAEYGHIMELKSITHNDANIRYNVEGNVNDPSGGEAQGDYSLRLIYQVTDESLVMNKDSQKMMDNFSELELIRLPLKKGTQWQQEAEHKNGKVYQLNCRIQQVKEHPEGNIYTVVYKDKNSNFYEKRLIQENWGVVSFETLWESKEGPVTIGYDLYKEASGYPENTALNAFLPPLEKKLSYFGLAEYGHEGKLVKVSKDHEKAIYQFKGIFRDGSGIPGQFIVQYHFDYTEGTIQEKVIENTRSKKDEVNSKIHQPIILKLPLEVGSTWQQKITFEGKTKTMTATIVSIAYKGRTFFTQTKSGPPIVTVRYIVEEVPGYFQKGSSKKDRG